MFVACVFHMPSKGQAVFILSLFDFHGQPEESALFYLPSCLGNEESDVQHSVHGPTARGLGATKARFSYIKLPSPKLPFLPKGFLLDIMPLNLKT